MRKRLISPEGRRLRRALSDTVVVLEDAKRQVEEFALLIEEIGIDDDGS